MKESGQETKFPARPFCFFDWCVGDDAHIVPANQSDFMETFDEFDGVQWVDVGINPYASVLKIPSENGELWKA
ncbi:MAG: hypothetical protein V8T00_02810 [Oscillospiraceae bacterium]